MLPSSIANLTFLRGLQLDRNRLRNLPVAIGSLVRLELLDQHVRLGRVGAAEDGAGLLVQIADLVLLLTLVAEIHPVAVVDQREDAAADRYTRLAVIACFLPGFPEGADLLRLLDMELDGKPFTAQDFLSRFGDNPVSLET